MINSNMGCSVVHALIVRKTLQHMVVTGMAVLFYFVLDDGEKVLIDVDGKSADDILNLVELVGGATERYSKIFS